MARVVVTGGAGFIGRHVVGVLVDRGHDVVVFDSLRPDVHPDGRARVAAGATLTVGDLRDAAVLDGVLRTADAVVHLAAKVGLGVGVADLPDYASSNDYGTACLLAAMARAGVGRLVLAGSMVVYGEGFGRCAEHGLVRPGPRPQAWLAAGRYEPPCPQCDREVAPVLVDELTPPDPRNAYAVSKLAQEQLAAVWARSVDGAVTTLRYHNVYGRGLPAGTPYAGVAALWLTQLRSGLAPRVFEDGRQRRDFVHVTDVAAATVAALDQDQPGVRTYNVGSGTVRTVGEMATMLATALGGPAPVVTGEYRLGDVRHITADSSRMRRELGTTAHVSLEQGLADLLTRGHRRTG